MVAIGEDTTRPDSGAADSAGGPRARSQRRRQRAELVRELRDQHPELDRQAIAHVVMQKLGGTCTPRNVTEYLYDPDGSKARARKESYRGGCERCGKPTSAGDGPGKARALCGSCNAGRARPRRHTPESIIATLRAWHRNEGFWPTSTDLKRSYAARRSPDALARYERYQLSGDAVTRHFGTFAAGLRAAQAAEDRDANLAAWQILGACRASVRGVGDRRRPA